jgi:hypothetical protein
MNTTYFANFFNAVNENIIIYNGDFLPEDIRDNVTRSVENLFNQCKSLYDQKIYRSTHCIWFILSKNIPEYYVIMSLKNVFAKAINKEIFKNALITCPNILQNFAVPLHYFSFNFIYDLSLHLSNTPDNLNDTFDLLA